MKEKLALKPLNEHKICSAIIEHLNYHGCCVWRVNSGVIKKEYKGKSRMIRMARKGTSDILGLTKYGRFIALEVKKPETRRTVTRFQNEFLEKISMYGGIAAVVTSADEALAIIQKEAQCKI